MTIGFGATQVAGAATPNQLAAAQFRQQIGVWQSGSIVRVPLKVVGPDGTLSSKLSVSGGIPFPMGQLRPGAPVRLREGNGRAWPAQTRPLATWEDGSIKWLLVTSRVPASGASRAVWLEYGGVTADAVAGERVSVTQTTDAVIIATTQMRLVVSKRRFTVFDAVQIDLDKDGVVEAHEQVSGPGDLTLRDGNNVEYRSSLDTQTYRLTVEESGPLRARIAASGTFRSSAGKGYGQFHVRMDVFAGLNYVRLSHTFVHTGYPANTVYSDYDEVTVPNETIRDVSILLPATQASGGTLLTGDSSGVFSTPLDAVTTVRQMSATWGQVLKAGRSVRSSRAIDGWVMLQNATGGILANIREAWQQFPKELEVDPAAKQLRIRLWPSSAGVLDLQTTAQAIGPDAGGRGSAFGLGKTHEVFLNFTRIALTGSAARQRAAEWSSPWLLAAEPTWLQATGALGELGPAKASWPEAENMLNEMFSWAERQPVNYGWYGMLNWGDTLYWFRKDAFDKSYTSWGWHPEGRWGWHNCEAMGSHAGALVSFLRTLSLKYFRWGERKARHVMDVDTVHYNTIANDSRLNWLLSDRYSKVGSMHRHNGQHWGCRNEEFTHTNVAGLLLYHLITGDGRALDVVKEVGSFALLNSVNYAGHPELAPSRSIGNALWTQTLLYDLTRDSRFKALADGWVQVLLSGQRADGTWLENYDPTTRSWNGNLKLNYVVHYILPALIAYHRLTGHAGVGQAIVKCTDGLIKLEPWLQFFDGLTYAYRITGNKAYLEEGKRRLWSHISSQNKTTDPVWRGTIYGKAIYDRVGPVLFTAPCLINGLDAVDFPTLERTTR